MYRLKCSSTCWYPLLWKLPWVSKSRETLVMAWNDYSKMDHEFHYSKWGSYPRLLVCHISPLMRNYSTLILNTRHYINPLSSIHWKEQAIQCSLHDLYNSTAHINVYLMLNPIFIWGEQCIRQDFATKPLLLLIYAYCLSTTQQIPLKFCTKWA